MSLCTRNLCRDPEVPGPDQQQKVGWTLFRGESGSEPRDGDVLQQEHLQLEDFSLQNQSQMVSKSASCWTSRRTRTSLVLDEAGEDGGT